MKSQGFRSKILGLVLAGLAVPLAACQGPQVINAPGTPTTYQDPGTPGQVRGVGIESQDIVAMTDQMMRDMLSSPQLAAQPTPPRVILDGEYFANESSQRINKNSIVDRLRVSLNRSATGRMVFVGRQYAGMVASERELKRDGVTDQGTRGLAKAQKGADFRLGGRITSLDQRDNRTGLISRFNQVFFEMVDLETSEIVWSGMYEFAKTAQDDVVYR